LTTATKAVIDDDMEDPDSPVEDRGFLGTLTVSAHIDIDSGTVTPSFGTETDERILAQAKNYCEKSGGYTYSVWFLEAEGLDVVRSDGQPFRQSDIIKLRSKEGNKLGSNQTHAKLAEEFRKFGGSASYTKVGQDESLVGRVFQFGTREIKLGGTYKKAVKLFPLEIMDTDFIYEGEARVITPKSGQGEGVLADGGASTAMAEEDAIAILIEVLDGETPTNMMDAIIADGRLESVVSVFGAPLIEAASDESLVGILEEHGVMKLTAKGKLTSV
jgi:hypothetical protein